MIDALAPRDEILFKGSKVSEIATWAEVRIIQLQARDSHPRIQQVRRHQYTGSRQACGIRPADVISTWIQGPSHLYRQIVDIGAVGLRVLVGVGIKSAPLDETTCVRYHRLQCQADGQVCP